MQQQHLAAIFSLVCDGAQLTVTRGDGNYTATITFTRWRISADGPTPEDAMEYLALLCKDL